MTGRPGLAVAAIAAGLALAAACSPAPHPRAAPGGPTRPGRTLRVGVVGLRSLDPSLATSPGEVEAARAIFSTLTTWDATTLEPRAGLATSWSASPDQRVWTFVLRPGAAFSSGRPVTPADVRYTLERIARKGSGSPAATLLADIAGWTSLNGDGSGGLAVDATPSGDVRITLTSPVAVLPSILSAPAFGIVPREWVESTSRPFAEAPVGSGPFTVRSATPGDVVLARAPGSPALVDALELVSFADDRAAYAAFRRGALDVTPVPPQDAASAASRTGEPVSAPLQAELFFGFNLRDPILSDARYRQAIVEAVDRTGVAAGPYRRTVRPLAGVVLAPDPASGLSCGAVCTYDPAAARALLAATFGPTGPPAFTIDYDDDPTQDAVAHAIAADLDRVGIFTRLRSHPLADYQTLAASGSAELFRLGWVPAYPGPDGVLAPLFLSGRADNLTGLSSSTVDAAIRAARAEPDPSRRASAYKEAEAAVMAALPVLPLVQFESHTAWAPTVRGLRVDPMGTFDPAGVGWSG